MATEMTRGGLEPPRDLDDEFALALRDRPQHLAAMQAWVAMRDYILLPVLREEVTTGRSIEQDMIDAAWGGPQELRFVIRKGPTEASLVFRNASNENVEVLIRTEHGVSHSVRKPVDEGYVRRTVRDFIRLAHS